MLRETRELIWSQRPGVEGQRLDSEVGRLQTLLDSLTPPRMAALPTSVPSLATDCVFATSFSALPLAHGVCCRLIGSCEKRGHDSAGASGFGTPPGRRYGQ